MKTDFIKKGMAALALFSIITVSANAKEMQSATVGDIPVENVTLKRNGDLMTLDLDLILKNIKLNGDKAVVFTPVIINGKDSVSLDPVSVYSRTRWYQYQRQNTLNPENPDGLAFRYSKRPDMIDYNQSVDYQSWMNGASVKLNYDVYSCSHCHVDHEDLLLAGYKEFIPQPQFTYMMEVAAVVKEDSIQGRAYVDFPVNQTIIYPDYRNNAYELGKIIGTIDSVKNDPDVTITSIFIKGTASPEGPYDNNIRLAKGRTAALKEYVMKLYNFAPDFIQTDYEPVDWAGLIDYLKTSHLEHAMEILAIARSDMEPYARNQKIKTTYPEEYAFLLKTIYPALRHSDYTIRYNIRKYTTVEEIAEVLRTNPKRLSLDELYFLAKSYDQGTPEYMNVMETAVRLFPNNVSANVNAANTAILRGNYALAEQYLDKAGNAPEALYARGNMLMLQGKYQEAADMFRQVPQMPEANTALQVLIEEGVVSE